MFLSNKSHDNHGIDDKYRASNITILFDIDYCDTLISRYTIISCYCMKPSKFKVNKCAIFSIMCTVYYIIPVIIIKHCSILSLNLISIKHTCATTHPDSIPVRR